MDGHAWIESHAWPLQKKWLTLLAFLFEVPQAPNDKLLPAKLLVHEWILLGPGSYFQITYPPLQTPGGSLENRKFMKKANEYQ